MASAASRARSADPFVRNHGDNRNVAVDYEPTPNRKSSTRCGDGRPSSVDAAAVDAARRRGVDCVATTPRSRRPRPASVDLKPSNHVVRVPVVQPPSGVSKTKSQGSPSTPSSYIYMYIYIYIYIYIRTCVSEHARTRLIQSLTLAAITPHSWRTGQKLVQKQLGPFHSNSGEYFNDVLIRVNSFVSYKISTRRVQYLYRGGC